MSDSEKVSPTLTQALGRLAISVAGWVAMSAAIYAVVRLAAAPDASRTAVMRIAKTGENYAMQQARIWADISSRCATVYEKSRSVNA
jgi:hypothetical protein